MQIVLAILSMRQLSKCSNQPLMEMLEAHIGHVASVGFD